MLRAGQSPANRRFLAEVVPFSGLFAFFPLQYIVECHGVTLLPQFLGMYRLNVDGVEIYVIVTRNVFSHRLSVYRKYDLKVRRALLHILAVSAVIRGTRRAPTPAGGSVHVVRDGRGVISDPPVRL